MPVTALFVAWVLYKASIDASNTWGAYFKSSFDLFRYHLADALGLKVKNSLADERIQWKQLAMFYRNNPEVEILRQSDFTDFDYKDGVWPVDSGTSTKEVNK